MKQKIKEFLSVKENRVLIYTTVITGIYPLLMIPAKIRLMFSVTEYYSVMIHYSLVFIFFFIIPAVIVKYAFKEKLTEFGFNFNNVNKGIKFILIVLPVLILSLWLSSSQPAFQKEYPLAKIIMKDYKLFIVMEFFYLLYYIGWEFLFRGFIINGLKRYGLIFGIAFETSISTILHYTKPGGEIILALIAGFILGYYAYKYRTIWFVVFIHWTVGILMDLFVTLHR